MLGNILPPYHSLQELNLDWILTKVKDMLRFLPDDGTVGQILRRTAHGAEWSNEQGGDVNSVNGQTGDVVLTAADVGALPDSTVVGDQQNVWFGTSASLSGASTKDVVLVGNKPFSYNNGDVLFVNFTNGNTASGPMLRIGTDVARPVTPTTSYFWSNNETVTFVFNNNIWYMVDAGVASTSYYGATKLSSSTSSNSTSLAATPSAVKAAYDLASSKVDAAGAAAAAPVQSVNGMTGAVTVPTGSPLDCYPVGSIYMSVNSTDPANLFGGTWQQLEDRFLLGAGSVYTAGNTGGEATHTLIANELPSVSGSFNIRGLSNGTNIITSASGVFAREDAGNVSSTTNNTSSQAASKVTMSFGGDQAHNNMPPYLVVYMWQRTA